MAIVTRARLYVKPSRSSSRKDHPFGEGLLEEPYDQRPSFGSLRPQKSSGRRPVHTRKDELWWSAQHVAKEMGLAPICGGAPDDEDDEPEVAYVFGQFPVAVRDIPECDHAGSFLGHGEEVTP